jgi:hypothetical protein
MLAASFACQAVAPRMRDEGWLAKAGVNPWLKDRFDVGAVKAAVARALCRRERFLNFFETSPRSFRISR